MDKIPKHRMVQDPKAVSLLCANCKLPMSHPVHQTDMIRGTVKPDQVSRHGH